MATFLQNIAPGVSDVGTGYLKGAANTQEKYRQEELTRQKDALATYMKLIESGHWEPVDPEKGATGPGVLAIGGMGWLQPKEIPEWKKAEFEQEEAKRKHETFKLGQEREMIGEKRIDLASEHAYELEKRKYSLAEHREVAKDRELSRAQQIELHGITRDTALANLESAKVKGKDKDKETKRTYTFMDSGLKTELTDSEYNKIMTSPVSELDKQEILVRQAATRGTLVRAEPTTITPKPPSEYKGIDPNSLEAQKQVMELFKAGSQPNVTTAGGQQIASQVNSMILDTSTRFYDWKSNTIRGGGTLMGIELPVVDTVSGGKRQMTMRDIRKKAKESNRSIEEVLNAIRQRMEAK